jgi:CheY-like chemotaxis protein
VTLQDHVWRLREFASHPNTQGHPRSYSNLFAYRQNWAGNCSACSVADNLLVLLVNGCRDEQEMYVEYLRFRGVHLVDHFSPAHAFQSAVTTRPQVVITDVVFNRRLDGIEFLRQLRSDPRTAGATRIVLTGLVTQAVRQQADAAGCDSFLIKPVLPEVLVQEIHRAVRAKRARPTFRNP